MKKDKCVFIEYGEYHFQQTVHYTQKHVWVFRVQGMFDFKTFAYNIYNGSFQLAN
jgi:hypothetical protein